MVEHFIIMASSYQKGTRIALQYVFDRGIDTNQIREVLETIEQASEGMFSYSTHYICTESDEWESVVSYDPFFGDAYLVESLHELIFILKKDLITGVDVAKYILTKRKVTHLALEKLTYLCYADYLCKYRKCLCEDTVYAFKYGPVLDSVYDKYSHQYGILGVDITETIAKSRFLLYPDGKEKIASIDATLRKYESCTASDMVDITHAAGSPWSMEDSSKSYQKIEDETIISNHHKEEEYYQNHFVINTKGYSAKDNLG